VDSELTRTNGLVLYQLWNQITIFPSFSKCCSETWGPLPSIRSAHPGSTQTGIAPSVFNHMTLIIYLSTELWTSSRGVEPELGVSCNPTNFKNFYFQAKLSVSYGPSFFCTILADLVTRWFILRRAFSSLDDFGVNNNMISGLIMCFSFMSNMTVPRQIRRKHKMVWDPLIAKREKWVRLDTLFIWVATKSVLSRGLRFKRYKWNQITHKRNYAPAKPSR
jgi:hypothetical protein